MQSDSVRLARFCRGFGPPPPPSATAKGEEEREAGEGGEPAAFKMGLDEWEGVLSFLEVSDRRSFSATSTHARCIDCAAWRAEGTARVTDRLRWGDLWYLSSVPLLRLVAPSSGEELPPDEHLPSSSSSSPHDERLCVCAAARRAGVAARGGVARPLHGVDVGRLTRAPRPTLFGTPARDERAMIAIVAGVSLHPSVRHSRAGRSDRRDPFFLSLERLVAVFGSARTATFALEALPWAWLRGELQTHIIRD